MKTMKLIARRGMLCLLAMLLILAVVPTFSLSSAAASGKTYYVAADGKDDNNGLSEDSPLSYFKAAYGTLYKGGDRVLFKRGDTFYGEFHPMISGTSNTSRVEIGAYGSGPLPIITLEKVISSAWTNAGNGFYKFVLTKGGNYTGVNNNVTNVGFMKDTKGNFYGRRFKSLAECTQQYDFYCDDTAIYVKSSKDPYAALGTLTLATHGIAVGMSKGMEIHDLHVRNSGQGFDWKAQDSTLEGKEFIHIYDCVIDGMGGTVGNDKFTRLGNCINLWVGGSNVVIENNLMRNTWDVAFTPQGEEPSTWRNVVVQNNIITYCTQAIEIWCGATSAGTGVNGLKFINNLCIKNGEGWGSATRETQDCDVLTYGYTADIWRMSIENNTFYHSDDGSSVYNIHPPAMEKFIKLVTVNNNQAYQLSENSNYLYNRANVGGPAEYAGLQLNFAEWKELTGKDTNSKITYIGNNAKYKTMEQVALTSIDFDEIAKAAKAAGLSFTLTYDASSKPTTTTTTTTTTKAPTTTTTTASGASSTTTTSTTVSGTDVSQPESEPSSDVDASETTTQPDQPADAPADDGGNGPSVWLYIGIGGGVLLVAAAVVVLVLLKKKQGEAQE